MELLYTMLNSILALCPLVKDELLLFFYLALFMFLLRVMKQLQIRPTN